MQHIHFSSYEHFVGYLDNLGIFHMNPSLSNITTVLQQLQLQRPPYKVVQIVGTNGKSSTASFFASLAQQHGLSAGLFTSPHFVSLRERIKINGTMLTKEEYVNYANSVMGAGGETLTYFEFLTALALVAFAEKNIPLAVLEAGLGGTWDSTSACTADMHIFTPFAVDHANVLGKSLHAIATDKAGAIRATTPCITSPQEPTALQALQTSAQSKNTPLQVSTLDSSPLPPKFIWDSLQLKGEFQQQNALLAIDAWMLFVKTFPALHNLHATTPERLATGLQRAWIAGRFHRIQASANMPFIILDGAHNAHGIATFGHSLAKEGIAPSAVIFTCLEDKEPDVIIPHLRSFATGPIFVPPLSNNARGITPHELVKKIGIQAQAVDSLQQAIQKAAVLRIERTPDAKNDEFPIVICGSLYLLAEFYALYPEYLEPQFDFSAEVT